jgi:hypothetical protein
VLDDLEQLLDFSFLRRIDAGAGGTRFAMAQTLREFGHEQLVESERLAGVRRRHAEWALALVEDAVAEAANDPVAASDRVVRRLDDLHAAIAWARGADPDLHLQLCATLPDALIWEPRGSAVDVELTIAIERNPAPGVDLARALSALGVLKSFHGASEAAVGLLRRAVTLWQELGDPSRTIDALISLSYPALNVDPATARGSAEEALTLAREQGDRATIDRAVAALGQVDVATGHAARAEPLIAGALKDTRDLQAAVALRHLWADCALIDGDAREAAGRYAASIRGLPALAESPLVAVDLEGLAMSLARAGHAETALEVDRIASAHRIHFRTTNEIAWWETLRMRNLGLARAAAPTYTPSHPIDDLGAAREWALGLADKLTQIR